MDEIAEVDPVTRLAAALAVWLYQVEQRAPLRGRLLRRWARTPFGVRCLLVLAGRRA